MEGASAMDAGCSATDAGASDPGPPPVDTVGGGAAAARIEGAGAVPVPRDGEQRDAGAVRASYLDTSHRFAPFLPAASLTLFHGLTPFPGMMQPRVHVFRSAGPSTPGTPKKRTKKAKEASSSIMPFDNDAPPTSMSFHI
ncbi:hypothetical protein EJB05_55111, partial [Eragrostis curvula]